MRERDMKAFTKITTMIEHSFKSVDKRANQLKDNFHNKDNNNNNNKNLNKASFSYELFAKFYKKFSRIH